MWKTNRLMSALGWVFIAMLAISGCSSNNGGGNNGGGGNGGGGMNMTPISCSEGTTNINDTSSVTIDGDGSECIFASSECNVVISSDANVNLQNCSTCIKAIGSSSVTVNAGATINCTANSDGIDTENSAVVDLSASNSILINAGSDGVESSSTSMVSFVSPLCQIQSGSTPLDAEGSSVINTSMCGQLITQ